MGKSLSNRNWEEISRADFNHRIEDENTWLVEEFAEGKLYMNNVDGYVLLDRVMSVWRSWI